MRGPNLCKLFFIESHQINEKIMSSQGQIQNNMKSSSVIPAIETKKYLIVIEIGNNTGLHPN